MPDLQGSLYTNWSCSTIPTSKNCFHHGRKDTEFLKWRWKPHQCQLPRFDPNTFLEFVQGKKLGFIGDSVARNHMDSLLCLLSMVSTFMSYTYSSPTFTQIRIILLFHYNRALIFICGMVWSNLSLDKLNIIYCVSCLNCKYFIGRNSGGSLQRFRRPETGMVLSRS